jgi:hypothetical protein
MPFGDIPEPIIKSQHFRQGTVYANDFSSAPVV